MTNSPHSPERAQFPEDRRGPGFDVAASSASTESSSQTLPRPMSTQSLPYTRSLAQHDFHHLPNPYVVQSTEIQPRPTHPGMPMYSDDFGAAIAAPGPSVYQSPPSGLALPGVQFSGPTSTPATSSPRLPRPSRRAKAHVARACQNCKKAHLSCDDARPCARCVASGKQATCVDVEHKKRGRPRLRDDRGELRTFSGQHGPSPEAQAPALPRSATEAMRLRPQGVELLHRVDPMRHFSRDRSGYGFESMGRRDSGLPGLRQDPPFSPSALAAFMNMEFRILKANGRFHEVLGGGASVTGRSLVDFVDPIHAEALRYLQSELRDERSRREPTFLPGIYPDVQEQEAVQSLEDADIERISEGYSKRQNVWTFTLPGGRIETFRTSIRLARTSTFFATIVMQREPRTTSTPTSYLPQTQGAEFGASPVLAQRVPGAQSAPTPGSPYPRSTPSSPFSSLPRHLLTTLPPSQTSVSLTAHTTRASSGQEAGYPSRSTVAGLVNPFAMQPPPQPPLTRPSTARELRRPETIEHLQLPPIVSSSAPTTPLSSHFFEPSSSQPGTVKRLSSDRSDDEDSEDTARKRRKLDIGEIIEQPPP